MAKNVQGVIFLRNGRLYDNRAEAISRINAVAATIGDGEAILARYTAEDDTIKTIVGFKYVGASASSLTLIDVEGLIGDAKALVDALRAEIEAKLGNGITSANTATAQLAALSGGTFTPGTSSSADTSVEGAKAYAYDLIGTLDYTDTAVTGSYVSEVTQSDGKIISTTKVELPSVTGEVESKKVVMSVSEDKGEISVNKGTIESSDKTVVISDVETSGDVTGIDFKVNIDGETLIADTDTGVISVASAALTQYVGDEDTIHISDVDSTTNTKTISSLLTIEEVTTSVPDTVSHRFQLAGSNHVKIGEYIDIPKDSALVNFYLGHVDDLLEGTQSQSEEGDTATVVHGTGDTALVWIMLLNDGKYKLTAVNVESFIEEAEFASGVTWDSTAKKVKGVVDPQSETFLTVGADGFKLSGVQDAIDAAVADLDATVGSQTVATGKHVAVEVVEENGVLTALTVTEDNIASADDIEELSGKTITAITSTNGSIAATISNEAGNKTADIQTDADKIKMSGFTVSETSSFSGITNDDTIADAFDKANAVITENERVTAAALNDLNDKIEAVSGASLSGVSVNNVGLTPSNNAVSIQISGSTATPSGTVNDPAIIVNTNQQTGAITLGIGYIDCGTYDD